METCRQLTSQMANSLLDSPPSLFFQGGFLFNLILEEDLLSFDLWDHLNSVFSIISVIDFINLIKNTKTQRAVRLRGVRRLPRV